MTRRDYLMRTLSEIDVVVDEAISHIHTPDHQEPNERARCAKVVEEMELARETVEAELQRLNWQW
jgi:hypothetical protein